MLAPMHRRTALAALPWIAALPAAGWSAPPTARDTARATRPLKFPDDFGAHPDTRIEWWYITGALSPTGGSGDAPAFGFQITFFRLRTGVAAAHPSRFAARQIVFAHAALSVLAERRLRHDQRAARAGFDVAEARTGDTDVHLRDWQLQRDGGVDDSRYRARLPATDAGFAFDLSLTAHAPPLLQGIDGLSQKGPDPAQASRYYSRPQLRTDGTLTLDGRTSPVTGRAWLDHEWSDSFLGADAVGWDWIGINLDDGGALTAFRVRRADGSTAHAGGSWQASPGAAPRNFGPTEVVFRPGRHWTSPRTQARYPVEWTLATPAGRFAVLAAFDDQELDSRRSTGAVYWEGLATLRAGDADGRRVGLGYLEMTGYAAPLQW